MSNHAKNSTSNDKVLKLKCVQGRFDDNKFEWFEIQEKSEYSKTK